MTHALAATAFIRRTDGGNEYGIMTDNCIIIIIIFVTVYLDTVVVYVVVVQRVSVL